MGSQRVRHNWVTNTFSFHSSRGRAESRAQVSCPPTWPCLRAEHSMRKGTGWVSEKVGGCLPVYSQISHNYMYIYIPSLLNFPPFHPSRSSHCCFFFLVLCVGYSIKYWEDKGELEEAEISLKYIYWLKTVILQVQHGMCSWCGEGDLFQLGKSA